MSGWQIYAADGYSHAVSESLPILKELTFASTGKAIRRIGRFIQLTLIGASRCTHRQHLPETTAIYFSSARGDLELTLEIMTRLYRDAQTPRPLNFVNTVSNAACFYLAQHLGLRSRSNFVCNRYFAFECALQMAVLDLANQTVGSALVGCTDIATAPLSEHRLRLAIPADNPIGEGSHWVWLGPIDDDRPRLGELVVAEHFGDIHDLLAWINQQDLSSEQCAISAGQFMEPQLFAEIQTSTKLEQIFEYRRQLSYYDCHSGSAISAFLGTETAARMLLHINADVDGRYSAMLLQR